jgi:hypothetical protein
LLGKRVIDKRVTDKRVVDKQGLGEKVVFISRLFLSGGSRTVAKLGNGKIAAQMVQIA